MVRKRGRERETSDVDKEMKWNRIEPAKETWSDSCSYSSSEGKVNYFTYIQFESKDKIEQKVFTVLARSLRFNQSNATATLPFNTVLTFRKWLFVINKSQKNVCTICSTHKSSRYIIIRCNRVWIAIHVVEDAVNCLITDYEHRTWCRMRQSQQ